MSENQHEKKRIFQRKAKKVPLIASGKSGRVFSYPDEDIFMRKYR
jgi:hypothetical protein